MFACVAFQLQTEPGTFISTALHAPVSRPWMVRFQTGATTAKLGKFARCVIKKKENDWQILLGCAVISGWCDVHAWQLLVECNISGLCGKNSVASPGSCVLTTVVASSCSFFLFIFNTHLIRRALLRAWAFQQHEKHWTESPIQQQES